jgi:hypothetical protein
MPASLREYIARIFDKLSKQTDRTLALQMFEGSIGHFILNCPSKICDYGLKPMDLSSGNFRGPTIENVHKQEVFYLYVLVYFNLYVYIYLNGSN